jgi:hypothetical protein
MNPNRTFMRNNAFITSVLCVGDQIILGNNEDDLKQNVEILYKVLQTSATKYRVSKLNS